MEFGSWTAIFTTYKFWNRSPNGYYARNQYVPLCRELFAYVAHHSIMTDRVIVLFMTINFPMRIIPAIGFVEILQITKQTMLSS